MHKEFVYNNISQKRWHIFVSCHSVVIVFYSEAIPLMICVW